MILLVFVCERCFQLITFMYETKLKGNCGGLEMAPHEKNGYR